MMEPSMVLLIEHKSLGSRWDKRSLLCEFTDCRMLSKQIEWRRRLIPLNLRHLNAEGDYLVDQS